MYWLHFYIFEVGPNRLLGLKSTICEAPCYTQAKSTNIHGQSEFDVFAAPVVSDDGSSVLYDGQAVFLNGDIELVYSFVNGSGYMSTISSDKVDQSVACLPPSTLPFNSIIPALNNVAFIPSASVGDEVIECTSGALFTTTFMDVDFAICASGKHRFQKRLDYRGGVFETSNQCSETNVEGRTILWCRGYSLFGDIFSVGAAHWDNHAEAAYLPTVTGVQDGKNSNDELNAAYVVAQEAYRGNVSAGMCSNDYDGIFSKYQAPLILGGTFLPRKSSVHDGLVEYQSCSIGLDQSLFGTSYKDTF
ncbi:hypothetical protein GQ600_20320 [Phytophthora cactorum]|nr:hypothetical protein GQ600_20320 [Phytophthora cactorum]